jgi:WD40 repeat protein
VVLLLVSLSRTGQAFAADETPFQPFRVAFAPDGTSLAVSGRVGERREVRLFDLATRRQLWRQVVPAAVTGLAWPAEGRSLFVGSGPAVLRLDARTGEELGRLGPHGEGVQSLAVSPDGKLLVTGGEDRAARVWDVTSGKQMRELIGHKGAVGSVALSPDGKRVLTAGTPDVRLWDLQSGKLLRTLLSNPMSARYALFAGGGRVVMAGGGEGRVRLLDSESGESRGHVGGMGGVFALRYHEPSHTLVWASWSEVGLFDVDLSAPDAKTTKRIAELLKTLDDDNYDTREDASKQLVALGWVVTAPMRRAAKESPSAEVRIRARPILTEASETPRVRLRGHLGNIRDAAIRPDGKTVATAGDDGTLRLWDAATGKQTAVLIAVTPQG